LSLCSLNVGFARSIRFFIPRHFRQRQRHAARIGNRRENQSRADERRQQYKISIDQRKQNSEDDQRSGGETHLSFKRPNRVDIFFHGQARRFPRFDAADDIFYFGKTQGI